MNPYEQADFIQFCQRMFSDNLLAIYAGDNYARVGDLSFAHQAMYTILFKEMTPRDLNHLRVLLADFPTSFANTITWEEFEQYPRHGLWQFAHKAPLFAQDWFQPPVVSASDLLGGIQHSIVQASHNIRKFFLAQDRTKNTLWMLRRLPWLAGLIDLGIIQLFEQDCEKRNIRPAPLPNDSDLRMAFALLAELRANHYYIPDQFAFTTDAVDLLYLQLNRIIEHYVDQTTPYITKVEYTQSPSPVSFTLSNSQHSAEIQAFVTTCQQTFGNSLKLMLLTGSQARQEADALSDIDSICVLDRVDEATLLSFRQILQRFPNASTYLLSAKGFITYPDYRRYTFLHDCQQLAGNWQITITTYAEDIREAIQHTLISIGQVSREFYIRGSFSPRAVICIRWQWKMSYHGCLRLRPLLHGETQFDSYEATKAAYAHDELAMQQLQRLFDREYSQALKDALYSGNRSSVDQHLLVTHNFVQDQLRKLRTEKV